MADDAIIFHVPPGKRKATLMFCGDGNEPNVHIHVKRPKNELETTVQLTLTSKGEPNGIHAYFPGDPVAVHIVDDSIDDSDSEAESTLPCALGIVMCATETTVKVYWFYGQHELLSLHTRQFTKNVKENTLSTSLSDRINIASIEKVDTPQNASDGVYNADTKRLEGTASSVLLYYETLSFVHRHAATKKCTYADAVDFVISQKKGMFASVGTIAPSKMVHALELFGSADNAEAPSPLEVGRQLHLVGENPLPWYTR